MREVCQQLMVSGFVIVMKMEQIPREASRGPGLQDFNRNKKVSKSSPKCRAITGSRSIIVMRSERCRSRASSRAVAASSGSRVLQKSGQPYHDMEAEQRIRHDGRSGRGSVLDQHPLS